MDVPNIIRKSIFVEQNTLYKYIGKCYRDNIMAPITILRQIIKNGWTIANRRNLISQIGKSNFDEISLLAKKTGRTGDIFRYPDAKKFLQPDKISATKEALTKTNTAYHGSPFLFDCFDVKKIGTGEGMNKYGRGLYLARTKDKAPFYANIRSFDAPRHIGCTKTLSDSNPTVYTVEGLDRLNLKLCSNLDANRISANQIAFQSENPHIDGLELLGGDITIFPESIHKLSISSKSDVITFVKNNKDYKFREWTTDTTKLNSIYE